MKIAVCYSLYGDKELYNRGAIANILQCRNVYPDYDVLMFIDDSVPDDTVKSLEKYGAKIFNMTGKGFKNTERMLWRWLPADPCLNYGYNIMLSRDCDSHVTRRERFAVEQWLKSGETLMTIHDSVSHCGIMGGLSSCKCIFPNLSTAIVKWISMPDANRGMGIDQSFLNSILKSIAGGSVRTFKSTDIPTEYGTGYGGGPWHLGCVDVPSKEEYLTIN